MEAGGLYCFTRLSVNALSTIFLVSFLQEEKKMSRAMLLKMGFTWYILEIYADKAVIVFPQQLLMLIPKAPQNQIDIQSIVGMVMSEHGNII